jgi:hypothetical protein
MQRHQGAVYLLPHPHSHHQYALEMGVDSMVLAMGMIEAYPHHYAHASFPPIFQLQLSWPQLPNIPSVIRLYLMPTGYMLKAEIFQ